MRPTAARRTRLVLTLLSLLIVTSMALSLADTLRTPRRQVTPTPVPTWTPFPTRTPTPVQT